ncbi:caspase family protein [Paracidovorax sp. MALMAid1276]|uniref:caspase family protein n=1 Tax=Paracidovorax sp. MALMAid1276 TaxID=3411631 RepID=UPI003B9958D3
MMNFMARSMDARRILPRTLLALALLTTSAQANAPLDIRIALVIGNSAYPGNAALANPANDAKAMAEQLRKLGFEVLELRDGSRDQMTRAIDSARKQLQGKNGIGMLYYAGHGLQIDWRNYMVPVDARPRSQTEVVTQSVDVDAVINAFKQAGNRVNILVLDACRNNPFEGTASVKGLAQIDAVPGTFLAYATAPGNTADDGEGSNGLYTGYLLQELAKPTARIEDVFKRVRLQVRQKSRGSQIPWESTSLEEDFVFNDGRTPGSVTAVAPLPKPSPQERDKLFLQEKAEWDRIKSSQNPDDFYALLQKYPNGMVSEAAQSRLDQLSKPQVVPTPVQGRNTVQRDSRVGDEVEFVYQDFLTKLETRRETIRVTAIKDGVVEFNNGQQIVTLAGGTIKNDQGVTFDPPVQSLPADEFQIGKRWVSRSQMTMPKHLSTATGDVGWMEQDMRVVAYEQVSVPAGTLPAYRIEAELRSYRGLSGKLTYWVDSNGLILKMVRRARVSLPNGVTHDSSWTREVARIHRPR